MSHLREIATEVSRCNKCGFCQAACPTYQAGGFEWLVTRGRVSLAQDVMAGTIAADDPVVSEAMDSCLVCGACIEACPPRIQIHDIVYAVRRERARLRGLTLLQRVVLRGLLPRPALLGMAARAAYLGQQLGLRRLAGALLPGPLGRAARVGPRLPGTTARRLVGRPQPVEKPRARAAYFVSCTREYVYPRAARAAVEVLRRNGVEVVIPPAVCCGLPCQSAGDLQGAKALAKRNLELLAALGADVIISDEGACTAHLSDYAELLAGTPHEAAARALAARLRDFSTFLDELGPAPMAHPVHASVTWHDPCSLRHYMNITQPPRRLIRSIPGLTYVEAGDAGICCGGAGTNMLTQPELADAILRRKTDSVRATGADYVVTSSPSCVMQLERGGSRVLYLSELLAMAYGVEV